MKRFLRILLDASTVFSLLLFVGAVGFWIRSYWKLDSVIRFKPERAWTQTWIDHVTQVTFRSGPVCEAGSRRGRIRFLHLTSDGEYFRTEMSTWISYDLMLDNSATLEISWTDATHLGFAWEHQPVPHFLYNAPPGPSPSPPAIPTGLFYAVYVPWWFVTLLFALLPVARARSVLRARKVRREGRCAECGYDLRATPNRCPECGAIP